MLGALAGPLISAGGAVLGGILGKPKNPKADYKGQLQYEKDRITGLQKDFGISPLATLGSVSPSPPQMVGGSPGTDYGLAEAAAHVGQGITAHQAEVTRRKELATQEALAKAGQAQALRESNARVLKDEAIAAYYNSRAAVKDTAAAVAVKKALLAKVDEFDSIRNQPDTVTSVRKDAPHITAGVHGSYTERNVGGGHKLLFPQSEEGLHENLESMWNPAYALPFIKANVDKYGAWKASQGLSQLYGIPATVIYAVVAGVSPYNNLSSDQQAKFLDKLETIFKGKWFNPRKEKLP